MADGTARPFEPRAICERCRRPVVVCYCHRIVPIATRTRVVILQHPRERDVPINTARIAALCLPKSELHVGVEWSDSAVLRRALSDPERPAALLYPGDGAIDVERDPPKGPITLIVVDGTWWQARKIVRASPALAALRRYAFRPHAPSQYRIRAEPQADYVSTIEALAHVLGVLEGDPARLATMLAPFDEMVSRQVAFAARPSARHRPHAAKKRVGGGARARLPRLLRDRYADLVCVHGEANAWPYDTHERLRDELVHWVAYRVASGEVLEHFVAPRGPLAPNTLRHLAIEASALADAEDASALCAAWESFRRPGDLVCAWGGYAKEIFERAGGDLGDACVDVRHEVRSRGGGKVGTMEAYLARMGKGPRVPSGATGRAALRAGELAGIVTALAESAAP